MKSTTEHNDKFDTHNLRLLRVWDEIQCIQTDFCFLQEASAYYMSDYWVRNVQSVLDVGTGNGYYLSKLIERFPEKQYTGIDISQELIDIAKSRLANFDVQLKAQDYFTTTGIYDFVIMRLFWQHLPQNRIREALDKLREITHPDSSVLIIDAFDEARRFVPDLPELRKVIAAYTQQQRTIGRNREIIKVLIDWASTANKSWQLGCDIFLFMPSTITGYLQLYKRIYELWIELFECLGELEIDLAPVKQELSEWHENDHAFTQAGLHIIRLDRLSQ